MPSFDLVSEVDMHEVNNAVDQSNREVGTRFDFKGVDAKFEMTDQSILVVSAEVDFQVKQMLEILAKDHGIELNLPWNFIPVNIALIAKKK